MINTIKAVRATILLGNTELDVFQLPDGKYFLSLTQVAESVEIDKKRLSQLRQSKLALNLYPEGFQESQKIKVEGGTKPVSIISLDDVSKYWTLIALQTQNPIAISLLAASQSEALERRADAAFNVIRSEQERNNLLQQRIDSKLFRRSFTDAIKEYPLLTGEKPNYGRITVYLYQKLGIYKDYLANKANRDDNNFRDLIPPRLLQQILDCEDLAAKLILNRKLEPCKALKLAGQTLGYID